LVKGNGRIVPTENVPALAHTLDELLANKPLRQEMGRLSQELIKPYNVKNAAAAFLQAMQVAGWQGDGVTG
jgi:glycosyltransferase involved in cell wall biosynthesis